MINIGTKSEIPIFWLLDKNLDVVDTIIQGQEGYSVSAGLWTSNFETSDQFSIQIAVDTTNSLKILNSVLSDTTLFIVRGDTKQVCWINKKEFDGQYISIDGVGILELLKKRFTTTADYVPVGEFINNNQVGQVMCDIINANDCYTWLSAVRDDNKNGVDIATYTEQTGNVAKYLSSLSKTYSVAMAFLYDEVNKKIVFNTYEIVSRATVVAGRVYVIAKEFDNANKLSYIKDMTQYYNYCKVIGDTATVFVNNILTGEDKYSLAIKANKAQGDLSEANYEAVLENLGEIELSKRQIEESFEIEIKPDQLLSLGWEVLATNRDINVSKVLFCTSVKESWDVVYKKSYVLGFRPTSKEILTNSLQGELQ